MADTMILERVESNLTRLRLPRIREILSQMIKVAEDQSKSFLSLLDDLLEEEVAQKEQRRIETALKISGLLHHSVVINIKGNSYRLKKNSEKNMIESDQNER